MTDYHIIARMYLETEAKLDNLRNELYKLPYEGYIEATTGRKYDDITNPRIYDRNGVLCVWVDCVVYGRCGDHDETYEQYVPLEDLIVPNPEEHFKKLRAELDRQKAEQAEVQRVAAEAAQRDTRRRLLEQLKKEFE